MNARKAFNWPTRTIPKTVLLACVAAATFAGCPPGDGPTATELAPGDGPAGQDPPELRPGYWMFALHFYHPHLHVLQRLLVTEGVKLNADGTTAPHYFEGATVQASSWSQTGGTFELDHDTYDEVFAGRVVTPEYIEGEFSDTASEYRGIFAARFIATDIEPEPAAAIPPVWDGHWVMHRIFHSEYRFPVTVESANGENISPLDLILHTDGSMSVIHQNNEVELTGFQWSQQDDVFQLIEEWEAGQDLYQAHVYTSTYMVGTILYGDFYETGTFVAYWVPTDHEIDPDNDDGPVIGF